MKKISGMFVKLALLGSVLLQTMYSSDLSVWLSKILPFHPKKKKKKMPTTSLFGKLFSNGRNSQDYLFFIEILSNLNMLGSHVTMQYALFIW